jgi:hypothetical protein
VSKGTYKFESLGLRWWQVLLIIVEMEAVGKGVA